MKLTDGMRWAIVGTVCLLAFLALVGFLGASAPSEDTGCRGHGGVVSTRFTAGNDTLYFICRDGSVVQKP